MNKKIILLIFLGLFSTPLFSMMQEYTGEDVENFAKMTKTKSVYSFGDLYITGESLLAIKESLKNLELMMMKTFWDRKFCKIFDKKSLEKKSKESRDELDDFLSQYNTLANNATETASYAGDDQGLEPNSEKVVKIISEIDGKTHFLRNIFSVYGKNKCTIL
jgi:hypothetical protein